MNFEQIKTQYKAPILKIAKHRKIENVRIFGSVAKGTQTRKSDIDFLVHLRPEANLLDLSGFYLDVADLLKCKVDVVADNSIHKSIKAKILSEAIPLA